MASDAMDIDGSSPEALRAFYNRLYPFPSIYKWLNQNDQAPSRLFTHREFAFTLPGDIYLRYQSFKDEKEFKAQVLRHVPTRFEIGPQYTFRPRDKKTAKPGTFNPLARELVFDIDMTDYDPIRTCCTDAGICKRCWGFIAAAVHVLEDSIRDQYGYEHLLWVYSGRRGIHLWISDWGAMELSDELRKAIVGWLTVVLPGKDSGKKVNVRSHSKSLPPSIGAVIGHLAEVFDELILETQDVFASTEGYEALLALIPDAALVHTLRSKWVADPSRPSTDKWQDLRQLVKNHKQKALLKSAMEDIVLQYTYPRLDAEVSKHRNHLLKAPFCVHPKTNRICVPVDPKTVDDFDPDEVPTVGQLLLELNNAGKDSAAEDEWKKTSLAPYVEMLEAHTAAIIESKRAIKQEKNGMSW
ncbi:DNA primase catalytic subunit [Cylindrobasidium torrendii FP15055 ss-10]|uniref:DNA primase n=1 Tax=Cylindrobasidium torrendii FP15055 ss-10 TaxID=1314674 RepID=A0A0D7B8Q3_9AGAR|nr:DNA primase catalytic subunit [Cylindrobasidium torrendii FP15055 ss-10]